MVDTGFTEIAADDAPLLHEYEVAPAAVNVEDWPAQMVAEATVTVGNGVTVIVDTADDVQPLEVPVTV